MRISWSRTGGFAGISQDKSLDTTSLTDEENQQLLTLIAAVDFFNLPTRIVSQNTYPDSFEYLLTVEDGAREHSVIVAETGLTGKLSSLVQLLNQITSSK
jgi:hypothetical protein